MITKFGSFGGEPSVTIAAIRVFLRDGIVRAGAGLMSESNRGVPVAAEPGVRLRAGSAAALDHEGPPERPGDRGPAGARRLTSETAAVSRGCDRRVRRRFEKEGFAICWSTVVAVGVVGRSRRRAMWRAARGRRRRWKCGRTRRPDRECGQRRRGSNRGSVGIRIRYVRPKGVGAWSGIRNGGRPGVEQASRVHQGEQPLSDELIEAGGVGGKIWPYPNCRCFRPFRQWRRNGCRADSVAATGKRSARRVPGSTGT